MTKNKRQLKRLSQRRPKERLNYSKMVAKISETTGFRKEDISHVWRAGIEVILNAMIEKKSVVLPMIGMLYPSIKPERVVVALNGGVGKPQKVNMKARWVLKFRVSKTAATKLLKKTPTEDEINDLYID